LSRIDRGQSPTDANADKIPQAATKHEGFVERAGGVRNPGGTMRTISLLMLLSGVLYGCAYAPVPSPQLDARTLCQQQAQASASTPEASDAQKYFDQCMIESNKEKPKAE
jgi:hypothetical protein